jgi:flavin-dependent dehydrogenase
MEAPIPASETEIEAYINAEVEIHFNVANLGYGWVFPHRGYFSVGIGGIANQIGNPKRIMEDFLLSRGFPNNIRLKGFPIPAGGIKRALISDRLLLAGDAAGFVDSFSGEGIAYAIRSGQIAAEIAARAIRKNNCKKSELISYVKYCENEFANALWYSLTVSRLMHRYPNFFIKLLATEHEVLSNYLDVLARRISYRQYLRWLFVKSPIFLFKLSRR